MYKLFSYASTLSQKVHLRQRSASHPLTVMLLILALVVPIAAFTGRASAASQTYQTDAELKEATVTIDNVTITIRTPFLPSSTFGIAQTGATSSKPGSSLTIAVAPFGFLPAAESSPSNPLPPAQAGGADTYRAKLREYKISYGGTPQPGPTATFFGQKIESQVSLIQRSLSNPGKEPSLVVEWVVEAGKRLWIIRVGKDLSEGTQDLIAEAAFIQSLSSLTISSDTLNNPTTMKPEGGYVLPGVPATGAASATLPGLLTLAFITLLVGGLLALGGRVRRVSRKE